MQHNFGGIRKMLTKFLLQTDASVCKTHPGVVVEYEIFIAKIEYDAHTKGRETFRHIIID